MDAYLFLDNDNMIFILGILVSILAAVSSMVVLIYNLKLLKKARNKNKESVKYIEDLSIELEKTAGIRKDLEAELLVAKEAVENAKAIKSQFISCMSHEIRTPLNGVMGMLQLLKTTDLSEEQKEYVNSSRLSSELLLSMLNNILDFSELQRGNVKLVKMDFNVEKLIFDSISLFSDSAAKKGIDIRVSIEKNMPSNLIGDYYRLNQIISNIVGNAVKFTNCGRIDIFVNPIEEIDKKIKVEFKIKDTGIGIPLHKKDEVFNSFSQVDNSNTRNYGGIGLGLSISRHLVELMSGSIWVYGIEGYGSIFCFTCLLEVPGNVEISG